MFLTDVGFDKTYVLWLHWVLQTLCQYLPRLLHMASSLKWECTWNYLQSAEIQYEWPVVQCQLLSSSYNTEVKTTHSWVEGKVRLQKDTIICKRNFSKKKIMFTFREIYLSYNHRVNTGWLQILSVKLYQGQFYNLRM